MWWYLIFGSQVADLSLVINVGVKYKVTPTLILAEGFKRKIRNKLLPRKQIPSGFSNSNQSDQHLWILVCTCICMHTHTPKITLHQTEYFFLPSLLYLPFYFTHYFLTILDYYLSPETYSCTSLWTLCPFFCPNLIISMTL